MWTAQSLKSWRRDTQNYFSICFSLPLFDTSFLSLGGFDTHADDPFSILGVLVTPPPLSNDFPPPYVSYYPISIA